jgi:cytosine/adenosine deaminase-related metal-dependent hydrolase
MGARTPGLVCAHHHLYSSLARGMPAPANAPTTFPVMLRDVWWRLDAALDLDILYWSAALGATEALLAGTTCIIDHHESPNAIEGSLDVIARACSDVGVRVSACYGATARWADDGSLRLAVDPASSMTDGARRGLAECDRYLAAGGRGMVGLHAAFTCTDETLARAAEIAGRHDVGVHVHVAEAVDDAQAARRLAAYASDDWLLVHAVHLDVALRGRIVHNPRSNMNNTVGYADPPRFANPILLGTDGIGADMLEEARLAFARLREAHPNAAADVVQEWLDAAYEIFPEAHGDVVTWSYDGVDEPWHAMYTTSIRAESVVVDGREVVRNSRPTRVDLDEVRAKAREAASTLHRRMARAA